MQKEENRSLLQLSEEKLSEIDYQDDALKAEDILRLNEFSSLNHSPIWFQN